MVTALLPPGARGARHGPDNVVVPKVSDSVDVLRQGWVDAATTLVPEVESVRVMLEKGLRSAEKNGALTEQTLLQAIDDALDHGGDEIPPEARQALVLRLRRTVYEYLLSLDAAKPEEAATWADETSRHDEGAVLIGAEEVAALRVDTLGARPTESEAAVAAEPTVDAPPEAAVEAAPEEDLRAAADPVAEVEALPEAAATVDGEPVEGEAEAQVPETPAAHAADEPEDTEPQPGDTGKRRFAIFGRSSKSRAPEARAEDRPESAADLADRTNVDGTAAAEASALAPEAARPTETFTPLPHSAGQAGKSYVAPREGFHIREEPGPLVISTPSDLGSEFVPLRKTPSPAGAGGAEPSGTGGGSQGWSVREEQAGTAGGRRTGTPPGDDEDRFVSAPVVEMRQKIEERLSRRRCDEAASLVQRLAQDTGGREVAQLCLDAGDRCRALGKNNSALSCYLAATRADPVFDAPLLRLADICIDDHDIDLAVAYLERVARFYRLGGENQEAVRMFRKIATIAPYRDDILKMLVRIQATGRFDD